MIGIASRLQLFLVAEIHAGIEKALKERASILPGMTQAESERIH
jgi:hypothetical protein